MNERDAYEFLDEQSLAAAKLQIITDPHDRMRWATVDPKTKKFVWEPRHRHHVAHTLESLISQLREMRIDGAQWSTRVYVDKFGAVTAVSPFDNTVSNAITVSMPLTPTEEFTALTKARVPRSQRLMIEWLTIDLYRCAGTEELLTTLRNVRFKRQAEGQSRIQTGQESITAETQAEMSGDNEPVPDAVELQVLVFEELAGVMANPPKCMCAMLVNPNAGDRPFVFGPLAGEMERAVAETVGFIIAALEDAKLDKTTVFAGAPDFTRRAE